LVRNRKTRLEFAAHMVRALNFLANIFPVLVVVLSGLALMGPSMFDWFKPWIVPWLGVIMLGMGVASPTSRCSIPTSARGPSNLPPGRFVP